MKVYVNINDKRWNKYKIDFDKIANMVAGKKYLNSEVSIILTNDEEIQALNTQYRHINKPTNVLSFELNDDILLGDIYISFDTVYKEAAEQNISFVDHTAHMVVHGILHLLGFDHLIDKQALVMESKEIKILKKLGIKNPYDENICKDVSCCPGGRFSAFVQKITIKQDGFWQYIIMALLGALTSFGFAPFYMWYCSVIGIAGAYYLMTRRTKTNWLKSFFAVLPFSAFYSICMFWWVLNSIYIVPELAQQFAIWTIPALIGIGLVGGIIFAIPFVVISSMCTIPACRPFLFAGIWTLVLWLREWLLTGFPWNPIANITMKAPLLSNSMSLWGALGLTFIIVGITAATVELVKSKKYTSVFVTYVIFLLLIVIAVAYGKYNIRESQIVNQNDSPLIRVIQPAQSAQQKATHSRKEAVLNAERNIKKLADLSMIDGDYDLLVFPETVYPFTVVDTDFPMSAALKKDIIIGANYYSGGKLYNSMLIADKNGFISHIYSKSHLVPFGEYRPLGDLIPTPGQLSQGNGAEIINININGNTFSFAPAICYEIIFSDSILPDGKIPDAIVNITNDTWFGKTPGVYQHLDMVRRYAIESGVPIIRANYSGISAFIASDGSVISYLPVGEEGVLDGFVWGSHETLYHKIGRNGWLIIILSFACICSISIYGLRKKD